MSALYDAIQQLSRPKPIALHLSPRMTYLPLPIQRYDDPFLPFSKAVIAASREYVSLYILDVAAYLMLGGAGAVALERTVDYLNDEIPCVLHGPFADQSFAGLLDKLAFGGSAITIGRGDPQEVLLTGQDGVALGGWQLVQEKLHVAGMPPYTLAVVGDAVVYKSRQDNFADVIRQTLATL